MGDLGSIPGLGRSPGEENSYQLQYSDLENFHGLGKVFLVSERHLVVPDSLLLGVLEFSRPEYWSG